MLDLSPTKILIILVVATLLLGPKRIPQLARQVGAGWRKLRALQQRVDAELRQSIPDLPSSQDLVRYARSPISVLNRLAEMPDAAGTDRAGPTTGHGEGDGTASVAGLAGTAGVGRAGTGAPGVLGATGVPGADRIVPLDDPQLN